MLGAFGAGAPSWSPDGGEVAFSAERGPGGPGGVFVVTLAGREMRRVADESFSTPSWSRDGQWLYVARSPQRAQYELWKVPVRGGQAQRVAGSGRLIAQESHDGKTLFFAKQSGGIWSMPVAGGAESAVVPISSMYRGYWKVARDGIFFADTHEGRMAVFFQPFSGGMPRVVGRISGTLLEYGGGLTVSPNGRRVIVAQYSGAPASEIVLIENFR